MMTLEFPGLRPQAKRRPRVTQRGTYNEPQYTAWRSEFAMKARLRYADMFGVMPTPLTNTLAVWITWRTVSGNMRPDIDNAAGAVLDALRDAEIIKDDNLVREMHLAVKKSARQDAGILVHIELTDMPQVGRQPRATDAPVRRSGGAKSIETAENGQSPQRKKSTAKTGR